MSTSRSTSRSTSTRSTQPSTIINMNRLPHEAIINAYYHNAPPLDTDDEWLFLPEVPDTQEMKRQLISEDPRVPENQIEGNWSSPQEHLTAQYQFLREESTFALRRAIELVRAQPHVSELEHRETSPGIGIYEKASAICSCYLLQLTDKNLQAFAVGVTFCSRGLGIRMCFSTFRAGVKIDWTTSKRLTSGSIIALSPASDKFQKKIVIALVGARPMELLTQSPPKIDIFFPRPEETIFDPAQEYVFLEETSSYFEAQRHNMLALQRMTKENTPLQEYIVSPVSEEDDVPLDLIELSNQVECMSFLDREAGRHSVKVPAYVKDDPLMDISHATDDDNDYQYDVVNRPMPKDAAMLDDSQMDALHQMLNKELALIQGPPGTGKTHVSVMALRIMLRKMDEQRQRAPPGVVIPPLIVACQTNHALDQLLRHVAAFEPSFIRLGGRSADTDIVKKRTLFNVMEGFKENNPGAIIHPPGLRRAGANMRNMEKEWKNALAPFDESRQNPGPMTEDMFTDYLTPKHIDSLQNSQWSTDKANGDAPDVPCIIKWLGQDAEITSSDHDWPAQQEFGFEEFEDEEEEIDEATVEKARQDDDIEKLYGPYMPLLDRSVLKTTAATKSLEAKEVKKILNSSKFCDLNKLPPHFRLGLYKFLVNDAKQKVIKAARALACRWAKEVKDRIRGSFTKNLQVLANAKVVGCTSTGFAKYRPMIFALKPHVVMVEEAGECLEANMMSMLLPSLQHLILVGDHQQLRPRAQKATHNFKHYDISLFERLARNTVDYRMLTVQRRMPPEVRRLLWPIYGDKIRDHECTLDRPSVPGLGDFRTYLFHHENYEAHDKFKSAYNEEEAKMIIDFVNGLLSNGVEPHKITVLTFYNGQRRLLTRELKKVEGLVAETRIKVHTVDSYQGEENDIIVLSLVRNNSIGQVGFLSVANRVCVALSRAKQGFYMFGNVKLLEEAGGEEWKQIVAILRGQGPIETQFVTGTRVVNAEK
ncbi:P-loop containing nucleoside triphosphate hydrolase protein [Aureobasidium subglaciale]|nr:P-loop containing nucleoside triphosphate hydrolase protein [Aureobasidium subglaciale]